VGSFDCHIDVCRPHGDQERDEADCRSFTGGGDKEADAAGEFGNSANGYEQLGVAELRRHD
jgi:hypothetical protein